MFGTWNVQSARGSETGIIVQWNFKKLDGESTMWLRTGKAECCLKSFDEFYGAIERGDFWTCWKIVSFTRKTLLHGVS